MQRWSRQGQPQQHDDQGSMEPTSSEASIGQDDPEPSFASARRGELPEVADRVYARLRALSSPLFTLLPLVDPSTAMLALQKRFLRKDWSSVYDDVHLELLADCVSLFGRDQRQAPHAIALMRAANAAKPHALLAKVQTHTRQDRKCVIMALINQGGRGCTAVAASRAVRHGRNGEPFRVDIQGAARARSTACAV